MLSTSKPNTHSETEENTGLDAPHIFPILKTVDNSQSCKNSKSNHSALIPICESHTSTGAIRYHSSVYPNGNVTSAIIHTSGAAATKIDSMSLDNSQNNALNIADSSEPSQVKSQSAVTNPRPLSILRYSATVGSKLNELEPGSAQPTEIKLSRIDSLENIDRASTGDQSLPLEGSESKVIKKRKCSVSGAPAPLVRLHNAMLQSPAHRSSISQATPIAELLVLEHTVRAGSQGASSLSVVKDVHGLLFRLIREKKTHIASCIMRKHILNLNARDKEVSTLTFYRFIYVSHSHTTYSMIFYDNYSLLF